MRRRIETQDLMLPPTAITAASLAVTVDGARYLDTRDGKVQAMAGRAGDIVDGFVARHGLGLARTLHDRLDDTNRLKGTMGAWLERYDDREDWTSDAGAIADVVADKLGMAAIMHGMWRHDIAPKPTLATITAHQAINASATLVNGLGDPEKRAIRPPKSGKYGIALYNASLALYLLEHDARESGASSLRQRTFRTLAHAAFAAGLATSAHATGQYVHGQFGSTR